MRWHIILIALHLLGVLPVAQAKVELSAFAAVGGEFRVIITDVEASVTSGWLSLGDTFRKHRVAGFDATKEVLTLERGGESIQLHLKREPVDQSGIPRRRLLNDGGVAERRKRQIPIWIDAYGNIALGATAVTFDEIEALFRRLAEANATVEVVFVHAQPSPNENPERIRTTRNRVLGLAQYVNLETLSSRAIEVGPER